MVIASKQQLDAKDPGPYLGRVCIAHDYLRQTGGAERVVADWSSVLPSSTIHTLSYVPAETYPTFSERTVLSSLPSTRLAGKVEYLLPLLPFFASRLRITPEDADVALVSTSGWAHQFSYTIPTIAYVHTPARWLYAEADYRKKLGSAGRLALNLFGESLRRKDAPTMARMSKVFANSLVTQKRIQTAYGLDSEILHPPVSGIQEIPVAPARKLPEVFALVVSRNKGYKNSSLAVDASKKANIALVIVGRGTEEWDDARESIFGLGFVPDSELRWLYQNAQVIIGSSHEDFGLTLLEANLEGTPVAAISFGGYLETTENGANGALAADESPAALAEAITEARTVSRELCIAHAEKFSLKSHFNRLTRSMKELSPLSGS